MRDWFLRAVAVVGDGAYVATFRCGEDQRAYRFTMEDVQVGATTLSTLHEREFGAGSLHARGAARLVLDAIVALDKAAAQPVALTDRSGA